jgi:hypothetical protein
MPKTKRKEDGIMKTMIYLDKAVHTQLRHMSIDQQVSMAELIRRAVDEYLKNQTKQGGRTK